MAPRHSESWKAVFERYRAAHPAEASEYAREQRGDLPEGWDRDLPTFPADKGGVETRKASAAALQAILPHVGNLVGGSADLAGSTGVGQKLGGAFGPGVAGRAVHWGVREHAMGACMNGLAAHGGIRPFGSTFLVFFDYMKPSIRLAALMGLPVIYVGTHDSIGVGEDGPTHQPVDQLPMLRAIPGPRHAAPGRCERDGRVVEDRAGAEGRPDGDRADAPEGAGAAASGHGGRRGTGRIRHA